ncbi:hypothetical protein BOTCAL_0133g00170 [Botryotinia calthae]|uniref:Uncharacterized protein n=1 Tax=Botryotinia calthae TaxID=38488 RepID=A0A4Y8D453_9HELO|nr:hypothetical protein BOTCAL_0133g00170 [Botryotinia calthae]
MDPLSVSASISGLISILDLIAGKSYKYVKEVRGSTQEVKKLVNEMTDLYGILNQLRLVVSRFDDESISSTIQFQHIDACRTLLDRIKERLYKADRDNISSQRSTIGRTISNLGRALVWPFSVGETRALIDDVTTQKCTLMFALQVDGMNALFDALGDRRTQGLNIEAIRANVLGLRHDKSISMLNQNHRKIIEWVAPYDPSQRHQEIATKLRQSGTGQWFTKGDQFKSWLDEKASKLWLYGIPGAGKTVLVLFYLLKIAVLPSAVSSTSLKMVIDPLNILGSLAKQLVLADRRGFSELEACWANHCPDQDIGISNSISAENLCELIRDISCYFDTVHLVVDALDECGDDRLNIVRLLTGLNATKDGNIKIILASRPELDIERYLVDFTKLSIAAHRNELELYVHSKIECRQREDPIFTWNQELKEEITQRRALKSLPPTLFETYERTLDRINLSSDETKDLVRRVLIWIVCAVTPLSLAQLLEAVSVDLSDKHLDRDGIPNEHSILKRCSSLVRKTEEPWGIRIELAHFSVKEFLLLEVQDDRYSMYRISQDLRNAYVAKYAFYGYASHYFARHLCSNSDDEDLFKLLKLLFDPVKTNNFVSWTQELLSDYEDESVQRIIANCNTIHFAVLFSFFRVVEWLVSRLNKDDIATLLACAVAPEMVLHVMKRAKCMKHRHLIARETTLKALLQPDTILGQHYLVTGDWGDSPHSNPLELAIRAHFGWEILLQYGALVTDNCIDALKAEVEIIDEHGTCFATNFVQMTKLKNVPAHVNPSFMQLVHQLKCGDTPVLDSFRNSIIDIVSIDEMATLHAAITFGQTYNVLQVLKKRNPNINSCSDIDGLSALHRASKGGHLEIVKILLNHGALLDLPTSIEGIDTAENLFGLECATSFHLAVVSGHQDVAEFLEAYGADIHKPDKWGLTPLHSATTQSIDMIEYLLRSPRQCLSSSSATLSGCTVLMKAADLGKFDVFKLFLQNSSSSTVLLQCEAGFNCLHSAVLSKIDSYKKIAMLRQSCINPCIPTAEGFLPLHFAAGRDFYIFRETLDFTLRSALRNYQDTATRKSIINHSFLQGPDSRWSIPYCTRHDGNILNFLTGSGNSILHEIVTKRAYKPYDSLRMLELLLAGNRDVNLEIQDRKGRSPLLALCDAWVRRGAAHDIVSFCLDLLPNAIWLLLQNGAVATQQDHQGNTAIHHICKSAEFTIHEYRCMTHLLSDDDYGEYVEDEYDRERVDVYREGHDDADEEHNDGDDNEIFDDLLAKTINSTDDEVYTYNDASTPLLLANKLNTTALEIFFGNPAVFRSPSFQGFDIEIGLLLLSAASIDQINKTLINGHRLLREFLRQGKDRLTLALLDLGVDTISPDEETILEMLCIQGSCNKSLIEKIVMNHVDKTTLNSDGSTMLHLACSYRRINILEELLRSGWKTDVSNRDGKPLIVQAIESGDTAMVKLLLDYGAVLLDKYAYQSQIVFSLSSAPNHMICKLLNEKGINDWHQEATMSFWGGFLPGISTIRTRNNPPLSYGTTQWLSVKIERVTPLHAASYCGNEEVIQYALDSGNNIDVNLAASFGTTPLFLAFYG